MQRSVAYALVTKAEEAADCGAGTYEKERLEEPHQVVAPQVAEIEDQHEDKDGVQVTVARNTVSGTIGIIKRHTSGLIQAQLVDPHKGEERSFNVDGAEL